MVFKVEGTEILKRFCNHSSRRKGIGAKRVEAMQLEWLARTKRNNLRPEQYPNTQLCLDHFASGLPSALFDENNPDWAPSLNLVYDSG